METPVVHRRTDGKVWIFLSGLSLALILAMMAALALLICYHSFTALWPNRLEHVQLSDGTAFIGIRLASEQSPEGDTRFQYKVGNRELNSGADFRWVAEKDIVQCDFPDNAMVVERMENGVFFGFLDRFSDAEGREQTSHDSFPSALKNHKQRWVREGQPLIDAIAQLGDAWQQNHLAALKVKYRQTRSESAADSQIWQEQLDLYQTREADIMAVSEKTLAKLGELRSEFAREKAVFLTADKQEIAIPLPNIVSAVLPNHLHWLEKFRLFLHNSVDFLLAYPREANTEGGIFPALFGTVLLVFLMAISAFPLGVAAGIYLREYAKDGFLSRTARIAVNNLAGVPSIVYGIFGLGFFVYGLGGSIDTLFYPERVEAGISTFGGGSIIWSSLTLGLLTLPVVIVATEEALATVPSEIRQGSLALGATRFQTLRRVILPMASPGILTGFILAMARAAGEVAPLMLTGVVKSAQSLPLDSSWPFIHLDRKFMHLGFHIYDMGFQSPNVEASKPLVYLTALALLALVFFLNIAAIRLRKHMHGKYAVRGF